MQYTAVVFSDTQESKKMQKVSKSKAGKKLL